MQTLLVTIIFFAFLLLIMAIRILFLKNGEFRGTCSTQEQGLKAMKGIECNICGRIVGEEDCGFESKALTRSKHVNK